MGGVVLGGPTDGTIMGNCAKPEGYNVKQAILFV